MKPFRFQQFEVQQSPKVFRVGTDAVLLGVLCNLNHPKAILEVGSGCGIISLMLAQRFQNAEILALDINPEASELASLNFENSKFRDRMMAQNSDFKDFETEIQCDAVVCNPPYFDENPSKKDSIARQRILLNFEDLIQKTSEIISGDGIFSVILPSENENLFVNLCNNQNLNLIRKVNIFGIKNGILKRNILEFSRENNQTEIQDFTIEKSHRKYSDEYLEMTKDFHIFQSKT